MHPYSQDSIVAIATPPGTAALAVVRISGNSLSKLYKSLTHKVPKKRYALYSKIYSPKNNYIIDEAIIIYFKSPNSFTGEDMIEITCHGSDIIKNKIIDAVVNTGARLAQPGEFSLRAFLNGKIDLMQAEAISSLISSKSHLSSEISFDHLCGIASTNLKHLKKDVMNLLSIIENELNFNENEIIMTTTNYIQSLLKKIKQDLESLLSSSVIGKNIFSGIRIVLFGPPNSGKSSLFNFILGQNRAIISDSPGTTRDSIEGWFEIEGISVCLVDTAGVWETNNNLDMLGVNNTAKEVLSSDICILIDEKNPSNLLNHPYLIKSTAHKIEVQSKFDLKENNNLNNINYIQISSKTNYGIDQLLTAISTHITKNYSLKNDKNILINKRQRNLLVKSLNILDLAKKQIKDDIGMDIVASTLRGFTLMIEEIIGEVYDKDVIDNIFKSFCVGK